MNKLDDKIGVILDDLLAVYSEGGAGSQTYFDRAKAAIKDLIKKDIIGHKVRSRFDDDYGGRKFADGYNQAKAEQLKRLEKL